MIYIIYPYSLGFLGFSVFSRLQTTPLKFSELARPEKKKVTYHRNLLTSMADLEYDLVVGRVGVENNER